MICIDPGKDCGWARFSATRLVSCGLWDVNILPPTDFAYDREYVIERPTIYPRSRARPNDIVTLALTAGRIAAVLGWGETSWVLPKTWKGTLDGDLMHVRIIKALTDNERRVYFTETDSLAEGLRHNVADAIGIGLHRLGRLTPQALTQAKGRGKKTTGGKRT